MTFKPYRIFVALLSFVVFASAAFAQNANSSIQGTVEDVHGAVIPGATIDLTNVGTNQKLSSTSNKDGFFVFTNLGPANYKISVTAQGFAAWEGALTLRVSQAAQVNPTLTAAAISTHVTVRDVTPLIDRVNATISDVKNSTTIEAMPVTNRSILSVLAFSPGVVAGNYGGSGGGFTRVNGIPAGSMSYTTDGQTVANRWNNELQTTPQSTMTLQEAKVLTSNAGAQYGLPGVVEMVTKSGTNRFHGQIFELNRNNHLQARQFHSGPTIPFLQHNEYGFQLGGPVVRNHTFFFFDMEWLKQHSNALEPFIVPTQSQRQGDLSDLVDGNGSPITIYDPNTTSYDPVTGAYVRTPFPGNIIPTDRLNPVAQKLFGITPVAGLAPYPLPNIPNVPYWTGVPNLEPAAAKAVSNEKQITVKVDQLFGPNRLAARYNYSSQNSSQPSSGSPTEPLVSINGGHNGSLSLTTVIGPNAVNVAHLGVQYEHEFGGPTQFPGVAAKLGLPIYAYSDAWPGFYWFEADTDGYWTGLDRDSPTDHPDQVVSLSDQFSWNRGNHQMTFGFDTDNSRLTFYSIRNPGGNYYFSGNFTALQDPTQAGNGKFNVPLSDTGSGLADLLLGNTDAIKLTVYPTFHNRQSQFDAYAQDDWRVSQKLTLNLGLRYQFWTSPEDASGLFSTLDPTVPGGMVVYAGKGPLPAQTPQDVYDAFVAAGLPMESAAAAGYPLKLFSMPKNNWEPRLGFAYQLNRKTVVRGGWGIYQWLVPMRFWMQQIYGNPPFTYTSQIMPGLIDGVATSSSAAELEFPIATANYGGPQPINQFMLGSQNCTNQPAGTCNPPGLLLNTNAAAVTQGAGFSMEGIDPNVKPSTAQQYNLTIGRELPWNTGLQVSYIGNTYHNLFTTDAYNYLVPRDNCAAANSSNVASCQAGVANFRRAYSVFQTSQIGQYDFIHWSGYGNTNQLQVQLTHTFGGNLLVQSYFSWLKALTTVGGRMPPGGGLSGGVSNVNGIVVNDMAVPASLTPGYSLTNPTDSGWSFERRLAATYSNDPTLPTKTFQLNANYTLPFGRGQRFLGNAHGFLNALVSGYNIAPYFLWHSGLYFSQYSTVLSSNSNGIPGTRGISLAPGKTGILPKSQRNAQHWFDYSVWDPLATSGPTSGPYNGQTYVYTQTTQQGDFRNNIPFNYMTGPGFNNMDVGLYKVTPIWRDLKLDFAAQIFNVYNHASLGLPNNKGVITRAISTPRTIQLQAKIVF